MAGFLFSTLTLHLCRSSSAAPTPLRSSSSVLLMRTSLMLSVPPVQGPLCGVRSNVHCCSRGGTWRRVPRWWRWPCKMWSALSSGPFVSDPTESYTASTVSLELPVPGCHIQRRHKCITMVTIFHFLSVIIVRENQSPKTLFFSFAAPGKNTSWKCVTVSMHAPYFILLNANLSTLFF